MGCVGTDVDKVQVLIIEDDRPTAEFFKTILALAGFECEMALNSRTALARLSACVPDLVILDLCLGIEIGGEDILYQIRSNPRLENTRVIVVTAHPDNAKSVDYLADLVLMKPIDLQQLTTLAQRLLTFQISPKRVLFRDPVTDLYSQEFFMTRLELAYERKRRRHDFNYSVLVLRPAADIETRSLLESELGVTIYPQVARRLLANLRPTDTTARFLDGSFAILSEDLNSPEDVSAILARLYDLLAPPYPVGDVEYQLAFEYGSARYSPEDSDPADILKRARRNLSKTLPQ